MDLNLILFDGYQPLDAIGPVEVFGDLEDVGIRYFSAEGGLVSSRQGLKIQTEPFSSIKKNQWVLIPGGMGTRPLVKEEKFLTVLKGIIEESELVFTVCTGSALAGACGVLDGLNATSNKRSFQWVKSVRPQVNWLPCARWVHDGKFWTSSGVSAGIDMSLGFVAEKYGPSKAAEIARRMEYIANPNASDDPYAVR